MAQAMIKRKINFESLEQISDAAGVKGKKRITMTETPIDDKKKVLDCNILTTIYSLNNSGSKKAVVGLHYNEDYKKFEPTIQFSINQYNQGVVLKPSTWSVLQNHFGDISLYFEKSKYWDPIDKLRINEVEIIFTTTYGTRSVIFDNSIYSWRENRCGKTKHFSPAVIMQKRTFVGLKNASVCIDERLRRVSRVVDSVNECKDLLLTELSAIVEKNDLSKANNDMVKDILTEDMLRMKESIKNRFESTDRTFLEHYYDIVFAELVTFCIDIFFQELVDMKLKKDDDENAGNLTMKDNGIGENSTLTDTENGKNLSTEDDKNYTESQIV